MDTRKAIQYVTVIPIITRTLSIEPSAIVAYDGLFGILSAYFVLLHINRGSVEKKLSFTAPPFEPVRSTLHSS
jgi:hypothetical protein